MELTLTITGEPEELRRILAALAPGETEPAHVRAVVDEATAPMLAVLSAIAQHSLYGSAVARANLVGLAQLADEAELNGVLGSIGRMWSKHMRSANPFLGVGTPEGIVYRIDETLADELVGLIGERTARRSTARA